MTEITRDSGVRYDASGEARVVERAPARERWSWALYDFANTIFSMNVLSLYFVVWLVEELGRTNTEYAVVNAVASAVILVSIPLLGAVSDARRRRKWWVVGFTVAACITTIAMGVFGQATNRSIAAIFITFIIANYAYQAAQPFYNAMLPELVPSSEQGRMSGIGVAIGYVGSIVGVLLVLPFFTGSLPGIGKLSQGLLDLLHLIPFTQNGGRVSTFVPTALLFFLFTVPFILFCRDRAPAPKGKRVEWMQAFKQVEHTLRDAKKHPGVLRFIVTTLIYQDAVGTIVGFMALYSVKAVGFKEGTEATLLLVLTIPAIAGSYFFGWLADRYGPKKSLSTTLAIWVVLLAALMLLPGKPAFWVVGFLIGLNFGGVNAAERPVLLSLVPDSEAGRYFSLLLLSARAAAIVGPLIWGVTVDSLESTIGTAIAYRVAVGTVALMFLIAWWTLRAVPDRRPGAPA